MTRLISSILLGLSFGLAAYAEDGKWEQISAEDGITTWRMDVPNSDVVAFKGETTYDAPIAKVFNVLFDTSRKLEWVARIKEAKDIKTISKTERIEYNHTGTPWPLKDRDFLFSAKAEYDAPSKTIYLRLKSVEDPAMPPQENRVRGKLMASSYTLTSLEGGKKTKLTVEIHADPMGSVPKWAVNLFQKSWPRVTLSGIRNQVAKPDVQEHPEVKALFSGKPTATFSTSN